MHLWNVMHVNFPMISILFFIVHQFILKN
jgi:hypothetical protein